MQFATVQEALEAYDDMLDESYPNQIMGIQASRILREVDPIAYRVGLYDYLDGEDIDIDDLTGWDEIDL